jgi:hypothetical protein
MASPVQTPTSSPSRHETGSEVSDNAGKHCAAESRYEDMTSDHSAALLVVPQVVAMDALGAN